MMFKILKKQLMSYSR